MKLLDSFTITYRQREYPAAEIPNIFINNLNEKITIAAHSLNIALFDDETGYTDSEARYIDEQIYAFINDDFFKLEYNEFIKKALSFLDWLILFNVIGKLWGSHIKWFFSNIILIFSNYHIFA